MEMEEAFRHALDGRAILFLGAGFSLGALNPEGDPFTLASGLSQEFMAAIGETESAPLQTSSELYEKKKGTLGLLEYLNLRFGVKEVAEHHREFAKPKWQRVYTTNYDEVFEIAAREVGARVRPLMVGPKVSTPEKGSTDCVHLNGYLPEANVRNFHDTIILSETAYLTNRFLQSPWAQLLRSDIENARSVIFLGYSANDLDIAKVLLATESLKRKCVFVVGENPGLALRNTVEKFGSIQPASVEAAAKKLENVTAGHIPNAGGAIFSSFCQRDVPSVPPASPTVPQVFDFFVKGDLNEELLNQNISAVPPNYVVPRSEISIAAEAFRRGARTFVVLSRLANGKTVLAECIISQLADQFEIFQFTRETPSLGEEVRALRTPGKPTLIVIDSYSDHIKLISELRLGAGENQYLLLTARTPTHLAVRDRLAEALGDGEVVERRVDALSEEELRAFDRILAGAGLLGEVAGWPEHRRIKELYQARAAGEFGGILLWLLDSPAIQDRLTELFSDLEGKKSSQRIVIAAMALTHIGQLPNVDDIAEFIGAEAINQAIFSEDGTVAELVRLDGHNAYPRSSLFAAAALRALWKSGHVLEVLEGMLRRSWELRSNNKRFGDICRDLMRFSKLRQIVPKDDPHSYISEYYERIRNQGACADNPLFWLQVTIADIEAKRFAIAERHLEQATKIAATRSGFDPFQIDNVRAKFLLSREIEEPQVDRSFRIFVEASRIISRQIKERRHAYYPYRVASLYAEFWRRVARGWEPDQRNMFLSACLGVYESARNVDADLAVMEDVRRARESLEKVLVEGGRDPRK